jgi:SAM-dependent methyltransferase
MIDRKHIGQIMQQDYEERWQAGDSWDYGDPAVADFERAKNARHLALLGGRRYARALEIGCGNGNFTPHLAGIAGQLVSLDIAASAIERARVRVAEAGPGNVEFRVANIMEYDPVEEGPWDLVVMMEMIYSLGWLYPIFDVAWLAEQLLAAVRPGGRFVLTNAYGGENDHLLRPYLINTYRDLFRNVGFRLEAEEVFGKGLPGDGLEILISLFTKEAG